VYEPISFTLKPFDEQAYKDAGGVVPYTSYIFDAFGVIETSKGKYLLLTDNDRVLIHPADSSYTFFGRLLPESQFEEEKRIAAETKEILKFLYIDFDYFNSKVRHSDGSSYYGNSLPAWYPSSFMPEPYGSTYEGLWRNPWGVHDPSSGYFKNFEYWAKYRENYSFHYYNDEWNDDAVYKSYASQLSGYDGYVEYTFIEDGDYYETDNYRSYAHAFCIYYKIGAYSVRLIIEQNPPDDIHFPVVLVYTNVKIDIR
jgi:hypothetical protein